MDLTREEKTIFEKEDRGFLEKDGLGAFQWSVTKTEWEHGGKKGGFTDATFYISDGDHCIEFCGIETGIDENNETITKLCAAMVSFLKAVEEMRGLTTQKGKQ